MHVRLHYTKLDKTLRQRFVERENNHINSSITFKSMTTSTKSLYLFISMTKAQVVRSIEFSVDSSIISKNLATSIMSAEFFYSVTFSITFESTSTILKFSHHSVIMMKTSIACSSTFSSTSSRISILSHTLSKIYMIINDLFEIFAEISNNKSKNIIQKKSTFSCFFEFRQIRIKSLCSQEDLKDSVMITRKQFRKK